ncbi:MAG: hypothetical protein K0S07_756 [Chlamydiales bacterium]|jgi:exodeoxyribonuclease V gamma subunit|nr:hypothetical protein [Chlamydiales bacterium]
MTSSLYCLSNSLEVLYLHLRDALLHASADPFQTRWVIVPSHKVASWLSWRFAKDPDAAIFFGFECLTLIEALEKMSRLPGLEVLKRGLFTDLSLVLAIEERLKRFLEQPELKQEASFKSFFAYFESGALFSDKSLKRLSSLSRTLAKLFKSYGLFGEEMCAEWREDLARQGGGAQEGHWQKRLFADLFFIEHSPFRCLFDVLKEVQVKERFSLKPIDLHFFAVDFIPPVIHRFLQRLSDQLHIVHYVLSPCALFWSDLCSQRQQDWILSTLAKRQVPLNQQKAMQELIANTHLLLANHGRVGRILAKLIEEEDYETVQDYRLPSALLEMPEYEELLVPEIRPFGAEVPEGNEPTLLAALKADCLLLRTKSSGLIHLEERQSIQIHLAPTLLREVEILFDRLLELADLKGGGVAQESILVLAPDIRIYEPYIRRVFEMRQSIFEVQIFDVATTSSLSVSSAFARLLKLSDSRLPVKEVLALLDCPAFALKAGFQESDLGDLASLIEQLGIRWGYDAEHRSEFLAGEVQDAETGTWQWGLSRALLGLAYQAEDGEECSDQASKRAVSPLDLDASKLELVEKLLALMQSLRRDLKPLQGKRWLSLEDWVLYLESLVEAYFFQELDETVEEECQALLKELRAFKRVPESLQAAQFPPLSIKRHLLSLLSEGLLKKRSLKAASERTGITFASYHVGSALSSDVICLLGMDEDSFPKKDQFISLDLRKALKASLDEPSPLERERYLFLETVLAAKKYLLISYQSYSFSEGKEKLPSLVVSELLAALDRSFRLFGDPPSKWIVHNHSFRPFDESAFKKESFLVQCHEPMFLRGCQAVRGSRQVKRPFFQDLRPKGGAPLAAVIDIAHLRALINDPFKFFLEKRLGLYLKEHESRFLDRFSLSTLEDYLIRREVLKQGHAAFELWDAQGKLPPGLFKEVVKNQVGAKIEEYGRALEHFHLKLSELIEVHLVLGLKKPLLLAHRALLPAIEVPVEGIGKVALTGKIQDVTMPGLLCFGRSSSDLFKAWPEFLAISVAKMQGHFKELGAFDEEASLFWLAKKERKRPFFSDPLPLLQALLSHYFQSLDDPFLLLPEWIEPFLKDTSLPDLFKKYRENSFGYQSPYVHYCFKEEMRLSNEQIERSLKRAEALFTPICQSWIATKDDACTSIS